MSDIPTMRARIADYINRSDINTQIVVEINRAIDHYAKNQRFWFNETTGTFSTVNAQLIYAAADGIPSIIREIDFVKIALNASNSYELERISYEELQRFVANIVNTGTPQYYAYYKESIYIYPIPSAVYTITVSYVKGYTALTDTAGQTNDFTTNAEDLIEFRTQRMLYDGLLKNDKMADRNAAREAEELLNLQGETMRLVSTGKMRPTSF